MEIALSNPDEPSLPIVDGGTEGLSYIRTYHTILFYYYSNSLHYPLFYIIRTYYTILFSTIRT